VCAIFFSCSVFGTCIQHWKYKQRLHASIPAFFPVSTIPQIGKCFLRVDSSTNISHICDYSQSRSILRGLVGSIIDIRRIMPELNNIWIFSQPKLQFLEIWLRSSCARRIAGVVKLFPLLRRYRSIVELRLVFTEQSLSEEPVFKPEWEWVTECLTECNFQRNGPAEKAFFRYDGMVSLVFNR